MSTPRPIDGEMLRTVMRRVPSPVTVVTAAGAEEMRGITIGSFTSVSLDPPLVSFNVAKEAQMHDVLLGAAHFVVHVLTDEQAHLSDHFAVPDVSGAEQFADVDYRLDEAHGTPVLDDVVARLDCTPYAFYEAGDHTIVVGEVTALDVNPTAGPVLYFDRRYCSVGEEVKLLTLFSPVKEASSDSP